MFLDTNLKITFLLIGRVRIIAIKIEGWLRLWRRGQPKAVHFSPIGGSGQPNALHSATLDSEHPKLLQPARAELAEKNSTPIKVMEKMAAKGNSLFIKTINAFYRNFIDTIKNILSISTKKGISA